MASGGARRSPSQLSSKVFIPNRKPERTEPNSRYRPEHQEFRRRCRHRKRIGNGEPGAVCRRVEPGDEHALVDHAELVALDRASGRAIGKPRRVECGEAEVIDENLALRPRSACHPVDLDQIPEGSRVQRTECRCQDIQKRLCRRRPMPVALELVVERAKGPGNRPLLQ